MNKRIVHFHSKTFVEVGQRAVVIPIDHPDTYNVDNGRNVYTSTVQRINEDGSFETLNSVYIPQQS